MSLAKSYLDPGDVIGDVYYFTALSRWDGGKRARHQAYSVHIEVGLASTEGIELHV